MPRARFIIIDTVTGRDLTSITFNPDDGTGVYRDLLDSPFEYDYPDDAPRFPTFSVPGYPGIVIPYRGEGTYEEKMSKIFTITDVGEVWNQLIAAHNIAGSFGAKCRRLIPSETLSDYYTNLTPVTSTMALNSTVAKEATLSLVKTQTDTIPSLALNSTVAKEATTAKEATLVLVKAQTDQMTFAGANINAEIADKGVFGSLSETTIKNAVLNALIVDHQELGSVGEALGRASMHSIYDNIYIDQAVYSSSNILTSCRVRIYSDPASVGTDDDVKFTYSMASTELSGRVATYKTFKI